jgi:hypothetical protein
MSEQDFNGELLPENPNPPLSTEEEVKNLVDNKLIKVREIKPITIPTP